MATVQETPELTEAELLAINVEAYKRQLSMTRINVSQSIQEIMEFVEANQKEDHFVNPDHPPAKQNPWIEKKGCIIL